MMNDDIKPIAQPEKPKRRVNRSFNNNGTLLALAKRKVKEKEKKDTYISDVNVPSGT